VIGIPVTWFKNLCSVRVNKTHNYRWSLLLVSNFSSFHVSRDFCAASHRPIVRVVSCGGCLSVGFLCGRSMFVYYSWIPEWLNLFSVEYGSSKFQSAVDPQFCSEISGQTLGRQCFMSKNPLFDLQWSPTNCI